MKEDPELVMLANMYRALLQGQLRFTCREGAAVAFHDPPQVATRVGKLTQFEVQTAAPKFLRGSHLLVPEGTAQPTKKNRSGIAPDTVWLIDSNTTLAVDAPTFVQETDTLPVEAVFVQPALVSPHTTGCELDGLVRFVLMNPRDAHPIELKQAAPVGFRAYVVPVTQHKLVTVVVKLALFAQLPLPLVARTTTLKDAGNWPLAGLSHLAMTSVPEGTVEQQAAGTAQPSTRAPVGFCISALVTSRLLQQRDIDL